MIRPKAKGPVQIGLRKLKVFSVSASPVMMILVNMTTISHEVPTPPKDTVDKDFSVF